MSRHNPPRLTVGGTYQLDGRKRRWTLQAIDADGTVVLVSGDQNIFLSPFDANKRLREVWT